MWGNSRKPAPLLAANPVLFVDDQHGASSPSMVPTPSAIALNPCSPQKALGAAGFIVSQRAAAAGSRLEQHNQPGKPQHDWHHLTVATGFISGYSIIYRSVKHTASSYRTEVIAREKSNCGIIAHSRSRGVRKSRGTLQRRTILPAFQGSTPAATNEAVIRHWPALQDYLFLSVRRTDKSAASASVQTTRTAAASIAGLVRQTDQTASALTHPVMSPGRSFSRSVTKRSGLARGRSNPTSPQNGSGPSLSLFPASICGPAPSPTSPSCYPTAAALSLLLTLIGKRNLASIRRSTVWCWPVLILATKRELPYGT